MSKQYDTYPATMPKAVLFGTAQEIEAWCRKNNKVPPTLLDLDRARRAVGGNR